MARPAEYRALHLIRTLLGVACLSVVACGPSGQLTSGVIAEWPSESTVRARVFDEVGVALFEALQEGTPHALWVPASDLDGMIGTSGMRWELSNRRANTSLTAWAEVGSVYRQAQYYGACFQGVRNEPSGGRLGLTEPLAVFERALVVGTQPGGARTATWVEGVIAFETGTVRALSLRAISPPRWEHSDLQLAACDAVAGSY